MDVGKLPPGLLARYVLARLGAPAAELEVPPAPGHDACVLRLGDRHLVMASDPALGVPPAHLGHLAVHYSASDVAVFGADPRYLVSDILLPPRARVALLDTLTAQMDAACRELGISIIGGHSGAYPAISAPVVVTTVFGIAKRVLSPAAIRPGMRIVLAGRLGLETACFLAWSRRRRVERLLGRAGTASLREAIRSESCVATALLLRRWAACLHDLTEGGLFGALAELEAATGLGADLDEGALAVEGEVAAVLDGFGIDPFTCSSTGALLAFLPPASAGRALAALAARGVACADIGVVTRCGVRVIGARGKARRATPSADGYARWAAHPGRG